MGQHWGSIGAALVTVLGQHWGSIGAAFGTAFGQYWLQYWGSIGAAFGTAFGHHCHWGSIGDNIYLIVGAEYTVEVDDGQHNKLIML